MQINSQALLFKNKLAKYATKASNAANNFMDSLARFSAYHDPEVTRFNRSGADYRLIIKERRVAAAKLALNNYQKYQRSKKQFQNVMLSEAFKHKENHTRRESFVRDAQLIKAAKPDDYVSSNKDNMRKTANRALLEANKKIPVNNLDLKALYSEARMLKPRLAMLGKMSFELKNEHNAKSLSQIPKNLKPLEVLKHKDAWLKSFTKGWTNLAKQLNAAQIKNLNVFSVKEFDNVFAETKKEICKELNNYKKHGNANLKTNKTSKKEQLPREDLQKVSKLFAQLREDLDELLSYTSCTPADFCSQSIVAIIIDASSNISKLRSSLSKMLQYCEGANAHLIENSMKSLLKLANLLTANKVKYCPQGFKGSRKINLSDKLQKQIELFNKMLPLVQGLLRQINSNADEISVENLKAA